MRSDLLNQVRGIILERTGDGETLTEYDIARQLKTSRTPIREVLRHLEEEGILERKQKKGIGLRKPTLKEIVEIYDLRSALEGLACRLLALHIDRQTLDKLKDISARYSRIKDNKASDGLRASIALEMAFHKLIVTGCRNDRLKSLIENLHLLSQSFRIANRLELEKPDYRPEKKHPHEEIVAALEGKDPDAAELAAKLHIQESKMELVSIFFGSSMAPIYEEAA